MQTYTLKPDTKEPMKKSVQMWHTYLSLFLSNLVGLTTHHPPLNFNSSTSITFASLLLNF